MSGGMVRANHIPAEQQEIRDRGYHPTGTFVEFKKEEIEQSIPDRFEHVVRTYPDRLAIKARGEKLTYRELNGAANRIAHAILEHVGEGEEPVALLFNHGAIGIAAILGALKAGKTCVSLDPLSDRTRIEHVLENSASALIITDRKNLVLADEIGSNGVRTINVDDLGRQFSINDPGLSLAPDRRAYIMYTSGSTGTAKGVVQNHRNLLHMVMVHTKFLHICQEDRVTLLYTFGSIGAVREILGSLLNGAALFPYDLKREGLAELAEWLIREEITCYRSVATVFRNMIDKPRRKKFPNIRLIYVGSEPIHTRDFELYKAHFSRSSVFVAGMGATEVSPVCLYFADHDSTISGGSVPSGYAVDGVEMLSLDEEGAEIGYDQVGEIAIKSKYLSLGYHRRPDLTQAAFLPGPSGGDERIYRTGDLGTMSPDGRVVHMGRKDFQVKIRGYFVDIGQVEGVLLEQDYIKEAAVVAHEDKPGDKRLVAYIVLGSNVAQSVGVIRQDLAEKLPSYMVPSAYEFLDSLPLTDTHKINRKELAAPGRARPKVDSSFVSPRTPVEEKLTRIWADVLRLDEVGIYDDFLELGGHSLLASQILSRVIGTFQVEVSLQSLFEAPTVADMSILITKGQGMNVREGDLDQLLAELEMLTDKKARELTAQEFGRRSEERG